MVYCPESEFELGRKLYPMKTYKKTRNFEFKVIPKPIVKLPPIWDYVALKKYKDENEKEYGECRKIEAKHSNRLSKHIYPKDLTEAKLICNRICSSLGVKRNPHLYQYINVGGLVSGYCAGKNIVIQCNHINLRVLLHELAHYVVFRERLTGIHHKDYLWVLDSIYTCFFDLFD